MRVGGVEVPVSSPGVGGSLERVTCDCDELWRFSARGMESSS